MYDVAILTLEDSACGNDGCGGGCGEATTCESRPRTQVLHCADALAAAGARVETVTAHDDAAIDAVLARFDMAARADGLAWPDPNTKHRLIVAVAADAQLRHVVRRLVRRYAPAPSRRPADLAPDRTVPDLPPIGILPLDTAGTDDLAAHLGLAREPATVARAVLSDGVRRLDLLRHDGGSVTIDGVLLGAADQYGRPVPWHGRVEVDDLVLTDGAEPVLACAVAVADGYTEIDGVALVSSPDPADGLVEVGIAVPGVTKRLLGRDRYRVEVRRARGRAVSVTPRPSAEGEALPYVEDGVTGELTRKRSWWIERRAWAVYA
jgi:hypothetical protein